MAEPIDFDAWFEENRTEPIPFKLLGKDWEIPGDIPAVVQLRLERIERFVSTAPLDGTAQLPEDLTIEDITYESLTRLMLGDAMVDEWLALGIGDKQLKHVTTRLIAIYRNGDGGDQGKAPTSPKKKRKRNRPSAPPATT